MKQQVINLLPTKDVIKSKVVLVFN